MDVLAQSALFVSIVTFSLGFSTWARNVRNQLHQLFAVGCTVVSGWALFYFMSTVWPERGYYGWHMLLNAWLTPVGLAFIQSLLRIRTWKSSRVLFWTSLVLCAAISVALFLGLQREDEIRKIILYTPSLILIQVFVLMATDRHVNPIVGVGRKFPLYLGVFLVLITCVMDHVKGLWVGVPIFGNLALMILVFILSQAVLQQRFLNLGAVLSRFLTMVILAFLLTCVYAVIVSWVKEFALLFLNSFITTFLVLSLIDPIRSFVRFSLDRFFTARQQRLVERLKTAEREIAGTLEVAAVFQVLERLFGEVLQPERYAFYLISRDRTNFERELQKTGNSPQEFFPSEIEAKHPVLSALKGGARRSAGKKQAIEAVTLSALQAEMERAIGESRKAQFRTSSEALQSMNANLALPIETSEGEMISCLFFQIDESDPYRGGNLAFIQEMEGLLSVCAERLEQLEKFRKQEEITRLAAIGEMAAGLAHEIRNPLGAIRGAAQVLDPNSHRPESRFLKVIIDESDRLNRVVSEFLDYSKPAPTGFFKTFDLVSLIQKGVTMLSTTAPEGVDLQFQSSQITAPVLGSPEQIHQVLMNLVQNAFKAIVRGGKSGGRVVVALDSLDTRDLKAVYRITVEDNGPGISKDVMTKIFIPFFTTDPSGSGLGLSICQKIIRAHGGEMEVHSKPGVQTQFRVILPCPDAHAKKVAE